MKSRVIRISDRTYRRLRFRSKTEGKPIPRLVEELADRPRPSPAEILESMQDLLSVVYARGLLSNPAHPWLEYEEVSKMLGRSPRRTPHRAKP